MVPCITERAALAAGRRRREVAESCRYERIATGGPVRGPTPREHRGAAIIRLRPSSLGLATTRVGADPLAPPSNWFQPTGSR